METRGRIKTVQITLLLRSVRILREVLEKNGKLLSHELKVIYYKCEKVANIQIQIIIVIIIIGTRTGGREHKRTNGDYPSYSNIEIGQNIETSPGDLMRLAVTQTPVDDHQLTLV